MNKLEQVIQQLQSGKHVAITDALRHLMGWPEVPEKVRLVVGSLFSEGYRSDELIMIVARHPSTEFANIYLSILDSGDISEQRVAIEHAPLWLQSNSFEANEIRNHVYESLQSLQDHEEPLIQFVVNLQLARSMEVNESCWRRAAMAIAHADRQEWWKSIRSTALELLTDDELSVINCALSEINTAALTRTTNIPFPWEHR